MGLLSNGSTQQWAANNGLAAPAWIQTTRLTDALLVETLEGVGKRIRLLHR